MTGHLSNRFRDSTGVIEIDQPPMLKTRDLSRDYEMPGGVVHAVRDVSIEVGRGQLVALRGRSGSGKTTLLSLLGALDRPTRGSVVVDGLTVSELPESELIPFRRRKLGFIFQAFGLLPVLSAAENVEVPLRLVRADPRERDLRVRELLDLVGLGDRANHRPHELSGGEQQRVAIARALANHPDCCWPTSRRASSIHRRAVRSWSYCSSWSAAKP